MCWTDVCIHNDIIYIFSTSGSTRKVVQLRPTRSLRSSRGREAWSTVPSWTTTPNWRASPHCSNRLASTRSIRAKWLRTWLAASTACPTSRKACTSTPWISCRPLPKTWTRRWPVKSLQLPWMQWQCTRGQFAPPVTLVPHVFRQQLHTCLVKDFSMQTPYSFCYQPLAAGRKWVFSTARRQQQNKNKKRCYGHHNLCFHRVLSRLVLGSLFQPYRLPDTWLFAIRRSFR